MKQETRKECKDAVQAYQTALANIASKTTRSMIETTVSTIETSLKHSISAYARCVDRILCYTAYGMCSDWDRIDLTSAARVLPLGFRSCNGAYDFTQGDWSNGMWRSISVMCSWANGAILGSMERYGLTVYVPEDAKELRALYDDYRKDKNVAKKAGTKKGNSKAKKNTGIGLDKTQIDTARSIVSYSPVYAIAKRLVIAYPKLSDDQRDRMIASINAIISTSLQSLPVSKATQDSDRM